MAKEATPEQAEARRKARRLATAAGKSWKDLSKDDRRGFVREARKSMKAGAKASVGTKNLARTARAAAQKDGRNWRELSKQERHTYLKQARAK
jgi:hypothetical protein